MKWKRLMRAAGSASAACTPSSTAMSRSWRVGMSHCLDRVQTAWLKTGWLGVVLADSASVRQRTWPAPYIHGMILRGSLRACRVSGFGCQVAPAGCCSLPQFQAHAMRLKRMPCSLDCLYALKTVK